MSRHTAAHYFLEGLCEIGVEYLFCNLGTDHVSLIEEMARWDAGNRARPTNILCPHENVAVHMAGGFAAATGRGQAVLVHVDAGTANAAMAMHNLFRSRLPVFLMAGRAPFTLRGELTGSRDNYVHFVQDPFDIGSIVRPYVKWEYTLPDGVVVKEALQRAHAAMQSEPAGPVYMTLPREVLAADIEETAVASFPSSRYGPVARGGVSPETADAIAARIMAAEMPVAFTAYLGRRHAAVAALDALAREAGIKVVEFQPIHLNIPRDSPCFAGFVPSLAAETDLGLLLDVDVPWLPSQVQHNAEAEWIQVDVDAFKSDMPMWGFPADMRIEGDCATVLTQVLEAVRRRSDDAFRARIAARIASWAPERSERKERSSAAATKTGAVGAIDPDYLFAELNRVLRPEDILVNEAIRNTVALQAQVERTVPGTWLGNGGGGLGFSGGLALGIKLALPERRVIQIVGDGSFHFSTPDSVYAVSQQYGLPIFTLILDNGGWQAVKQSVARVYPDGAAARSDSFQSRLEGASRRLEKVAEAFGAYAENVSDPAEVGAALQRCFEALESGRSAVLCAKVTPL